MELCVDGVAVAALDDGDGDVIVGRRSGDPGDGAIDGDGLNEFEVGVVAAEFVDRADEDLGAA